MSAAPSATSSQAAARACRTDVRRRTSARRGGDVRNRLGRARSPVPGAAVDSDAARTSARARRRGADAIRPGARRGNRGPDGRRARSPDGVRQPSASGHRVRPAAHGRRRRSERRGWRSRAPGSPTRPVSPSSPPDIWTDILASNADSRPGRHRRAGAGARAPADGSARHRTESRSSSSRRERGGARSRGSARRRAPPARRLTDNSSTREIPATRTYLEMLERPASTRPLPDGISAGSCVRTCPPSFFRFLYREVGRAWNWLDRLSWSDEEIRRLSHPAGARTVGL